MFYKIISRIKRYSESLYRKYYKSKFTIVVDALNVREINKRVLDLTRFCYFDQQDRIVQDLSKYFLFKHFHIPFNEDVVYKVNSKVEKTNAVQYKVKSQGLENDWIYMVYKGVPRNYKISFDITLLANFKEFQVAFRHTNLFKRLRFRIVDTNTLVFEIVDRGIFFNSFITKEYRFDIGRKYNIQVVVCENRYILLINNKVELSIMSTCSSFNGEDLAIVFWDDSSKSNINALIESIYLTEII